jgi:hypothetical protein
MFLDCIVRVVEHSKLSIIRLTWPTKIFVGGDLLCFLMQAAGAGMLTKTDALKATKNLGKKIINAELTMQLFVFGIFVIMTAVFRL